MGDIGVYFNRHEFSCKDGCGFDTVDVILIMWLSMLRERYSPVIINSGCRCLNYNRSIGSSDTSQHVDGRAADINVPNTSTREIYDYLEAIMGNNGGLGLYEQFVHVDSRTNGPARW
jgi:uncharacterized protein YcbK (DUF882 family)